MPFYRITIWLKSQRKPLQGIRFLNQTNIDFAQKMIEDKATGYFPYGHIVDVEVAMLSKNNKVIKKYQQFILRKSGKLND